jgi:hypothetical protein
VDWLLKQWKIIEANVKYSLALLIGTGIVTGVGIITHGLRWWQQAVLTGCFTLLFGWAVTATALASRRRKNALRDHITPEELGRRLEEQDGKIESARMGGIARAVDVDVKHDERLRKLEEGQFSIAVNGVPIAGPAAVAAEKAKERLGLQTSQLQKDAFQFAEELRFWLVSLAPLATPPAIAGEDAEEFIKRKWPQHERYTNKLIYEYAEKFADRARRLYFRFAADGFQDGILAGLIDTVGAGMNASEVATRFEALALRQLMPQACALLRQQQ